jgi:hypothetical protein
VYAPAPFTPARIRAFAEHMRSGYRPARRGTA